MTLDPAGREYRILLSGKEIGGVPVGPVRTKSGTMTGVEASSWINKRYRGLNIYPKVLGEILKREGRLASGGSLSGPAYKQWSKFSKNSPGVVFEGSGSLSLLKRRDDGRVFRASRPETGEPVFIARKPRRWTR